MTSTPPVTLKCGTHRYSPATCKSAIEQNFTSVMMDGSLKEDGKTPADYAYNVQTTKAFSGTPKSSGTL